METLTISIIIITIFSLGFCIYQSGKENIFHQKSVVLDGWYYSKTKAGWLKLKVMDRIEEVDVKTSVYKLFQAGDSVDLAIGRGINGFYIIYKISKL